MSRLIPQPLLFLQDNNGRPISGAKCSTYLSQTSTPVVTYQDSLLATPHSNPITSLNNGFFPAIYSSAGIELKLILHDPAGTVPDQTIDPASPFVLTQEEVGQALYPITPAEEAASVTPTNYSTAQYTATRYGTAGNGITDDTTALQNAINAAQQAGADLLIPDGTYGISTTLQITKKLKISMTPGAIIRALGTFPNPASIDNATWMVKVTGATAAGTRLSGFNLHGNGVALGLGIFTTSKVRVVGSWITDTRGPGTYLEDVAHSSVTGGLYERCGVDPGASTGAYTTTLRSNGGAGTNEHIHFHGNMILDSGGKGIVFSVTTRSIASNNFVKDCVADHGAAFYAAFSSYIQFIGNTGSGSSATGAEIIKISEQASFVTVRGNDFIQNIDKDIIVFQDCHIITIDGNFFTRTVATSTNRQHVRVNNVNGTSDIVISRNSFHGHAQTNTLAIAASVATNITVTNNHFQNFSAGVQVTTDGAIVRGNTYRNVTLPEQLAGATNATADYSSLKLRTTSDQAASGVGATTLSLTLPAGIMDRVGGIRVKGSGTKTGSAGNKTIAFRFGTTDFTINAAANDTNSWYFDATVLNVNETSQRVQGIGFNGATALPIVGTAAEDTGTALGVGVRATNAGADTVTLKMLTVELLP
jgi:hypothetical protein